MKEACGVVGDRRPGPRRRRTSATTPSTPCSTGARSRPAWRRVRRAPVTVVKDNGLVSSVFSSATLSALPGAAVIGHTRYSTSGSANWTAAQPVYRDAGSARLRAGAQRQPDQHRRARRARGHAGHRHALATRTWWPSCWRARSRPARTLSAAMAAVLPGVEGAYSMVLLEPGAVHAVRDPYGLRPLCLGRLGHRRRARGLGRRLRVPGARRRRRDLRARGRARRARHAHRRGRRLDAAPGAGRRRARCASSSSSTSPGPTPTSWAARSTRRAAGWASAWPSSRRSTPTS